ncbi:MAG: hypothetical protein WD801_00120 [Gemmatimonadaceae bacterium]
MSQRTKRIAAVFGVAGMCAVLWGFASHSRTALPGDLPKPLGQMTSDELWAAGNGLRFDNGPVQGRECQKGACMGRVDAVRDQQPGAGTISPNGTIVARLVNLGRPSGGDDDGPENRYGMGRGGNAEFYIIALRDGESGWRWTVREAIRNNAGAPRETASGSWVTCAHTPSTPGHPKGRSEFASCSTQAGDDAEASASGPRAPADHSHSSAVPTTYNPRDPAWLTCTDGCCTAGQ